MAKLQKLKILAGGRSIRVSSFHRESSFSAMIHMYHHGTRRFIGQIVHTWRDENNGDMIRVPHSAAVANKPAMHGCVRSLAARTLTSS